MDWLLQRRGHGGGTGPAAVFRCARSAHLQLARLRIGEWGDGLDADADGMECARSLVESERGGEVARGASSMPNQWVRPPYRRGRFVVVGLGVGFFATATGFEGEVEVEAGEAETEAEAEVGKAAPGNR